MTLSVAVLRREARVATRCPRCLEFVVTTHVWRCGRCDAVHHADCAREHGSCAVSGCFERHMERRARTREAAAGARFAVARFVFATALVLGVGWLGVRVIHSRLDALSGESAALRR